MLNSFKLTLLLTALAAIQLGGCEDSTTEQTSSESTTTETAEDESSSAESDSGDSADANATEPIGADEVKREVSEAAEATKQFATQKKDEYVQQLDDQLKQMDQRIDKLKSKGEGLADAAKEQWKKSLADLRKQRQEYQQKYDKLTAASGEAWQEMRQGIDEAWRDLQQAADAAAQQFDGDSSPEESE